MNGSYLCSALLVWLFVASTPTPARQTSAATTATPVPTSATAPDSQTDSALTREQLEIHFARAVALAKSGSTDEAKKLFQALIVINPDLVEAYVNLAYLLSAEGQLDHSADALETALSVHPVCRAVTELRFVDQLFESPAPAVAPAVPPAEAKYSQVTELLDALESWRHAWQEKRIDDYLSAYSSRFEPPSGLARVEWEHQRRSRIATAGAIRVSVVIQRIEVGSPTAASVRFRQVYEDESFRDSVDNELRFEKNDAGWSIVAELSPAPTAKPSSTP